MERSKKLARDDLAELGFSTIYLAPPTPRPTRRKGHKGFISAGSNDPFGFDAIAVNWNLWHGVQATEEGHAADRRGKVDKGFPEHPPNTIVDVWEYIFRKDENDKRKVVYRMNLSRRFNIGTVEAPVLQWFLLKKGVWRPVTVRGGVTPRRAGGRKGEKQEKTSKLFMSSDCVPKAATTWVALNDGVCNSIPKYSSVVKDSPRVAGGIEEGKAVH
jgi:hypothetical protein